MSAFSPTPHRFVPHLRWQVRLAYPEPDIMCEYRKQPGQPDGDAGDPYNGYDRFGRTVDMPWTTPIT